jgi:hypothetical protein
MGWQVSAENIAENNLQTWNRSLELLAAGDYEKGFEEFAIRWQLFPRLMSARAQQWAQWLPYWNGEDITGKRLIILAEQGFGDTIMLLRFVPMLKDMSIDVALELPAELERLAAQLAPIARAPLADYVVAAYDIMRRLRQTPATIPRGAYLAPDRGLREKWTRRIGARRHVGIAWSTTCKYPGEQARSIALNDFLAFVECKPEECVSLQAHDHEAARAEGILTIEAGDFADIAAIASLMDTIISIDTAALHVAGAIGHPDVLGILPEVPNWRWSAPWYPEMKFIRRPCHAYEAA